MSFEILETVDHDPASFTQGYERYKNSIVESSGGYGTSSIQLTDFETGQVILRQTVADTYFAEGLTVVDDTVVQLTWREETAFRWRVDDLTALEPWPYQGEGWGLCDNGSDLWMSNGSAQLTRRNRTTFAPLGTIDVTLDNEPVTQLNELECVDGLIMANVWQSETIVVINPDTGSVTATIDLASIMPPNPPGVANGIAALGDGTLLLTGKNWPEASVVKLSAP